MIIVFKFLINSFFFFFLKAEPNDDNLAEVTLVEGIFGIERLYIVLHL